MLRGTTPTKSNGCLKCKYPTGQQTATEKTDNSIFLSMPNNFDFCLYSSQTADNTETLPAVDMSNFVLILTAV